MSKNDTSAKSDKPLTIKQEELLALLLAGVSITAAASQLNVAEITVRRWTKLPTFDHAYQIAREDQLRQVLVGLQRQSVAALKKHVQADVEPSASTQLGAIKLIFDQVTLLGKMSEMEAKLDRLEEYIKQEGNNRR